MSKILDEEDDNGNIEYKRFILLDNELKKNQLLTQLKWRLLEGDGEATYYLGIDDDGSCSNVSKEILNDSFANLLILIKEANATVILWENVAPTAMMMVWVLSCNCS